MRYRNPCGEPVVPQEGGTGHMGEGAVILPRVKGEEWVYSSSERVQGRESGCAEGIRLPFRGVLGLGLLSDPLKGLHSPKLGSWVRPRAASRRALEPYRVSARAFSAGGVKSEMLMFSLSAPCVAQGEKAA